MENNHLNNKALVNQKNIRLAMIGVTTGNGHPYSWSAIFCAFKAQLEAFIQYLRTGTRPFPSSETTELMQLVVAGIDSRNANGREVELEE